jgi:hypothetical protein
MPLQPAPRAQPGQRQQREQRVEDHRRPQVLVAEQRHAEAVDGDPDDPVLEELAPQQPGAQHAADGRQRVEPGHVGVGVAQQPFCERPRQQRERQRDERMAPLQPVHHQRAAVSPAAAQPLPPAPHRHRDEEQLQRGLAIQLAVDEQKRVHQRRRHRQRPGERVHAHLAAHHPQRDCERHDLDPRHRRAPGAEGRGEQGVGGGEDGGEERLQHQVRAHGGARAGTHEACGARVTCRA